VRPDVPPEILALARARSAARRSRDFAAADRLKDEIEAAGWRVVDRGGESTVHPAHPADVVTPDGIRYGWSGAVPARTGEPEGDGATVILVAGQDPEPAARTLAALAAHAPAGTETVVVAGPEAALDAWLATLAGCVVGGRSPEVVRMARPVSPAVARNAGGRRAGGRIVVWIAAGVEPVGDPIGPLVAALEDPGVAVAGAIGLAGTDVRRLAPASGAPVVAIDRTLLAFRRSDLIALGPLDEAHFGETTLDRWWSLVLRDGPEPPEGTDPEPRRALALDLPLATAGIAAPAPEDPDPSEAERRRKRDLYRLIDRFARRPDLLGGAG